MSIMSTITICPACQAEIPADTTVCPQCGFRLQGRTEPFDPLELSDSDFSPPSYHCSAPQLTLIKGPSKGEVFHLDSFPVTVGRDPICDIFLNNMTVSRQHAIIERKGGQIIVRDNHSLNGTWVNGEIVEEAELTESSLLQIGTFSMRFDCGPSES
jgi:hypothetical protein